MRAKSHILAARHRALLALVERNTNVAGSGEAILDNVNLQADEQVEVLVLQAALRALGFPTNRQTAFNIWTEMDRDKLPLTTGTESSALDDAIARIVTLCDSIATDTKLNGPLV